MVKNCFSIFNFFEEYKFVGDFFQGGQHKLKLFLFCLNKIVEIFFEIFVGGDFFVGFQHFYEKWNICKAIPPPPIE